MKGPINLFDLLIGFGFGVGFALLALRLSGLINQDAAMWWAAFLLPTQALWIARFVKSRGIVQGERER